MRQLKMFGTSSLALAVLLACASVVAAGGELQDDLKARRERLMAKLGPDALFVQWSAPTRVYSRDVDYEYRQDSDLLYLTGLDQEDTILVLMPGNQAKREILFVSDADPKREHREGHLLSAEEATARSGIATVFKRSEFDGFFRAIMNRRAFRARSGEIDTEYDAFFAALAESRAKLALLFDARPGLHDELPPIYELARQARDRYPDARVVDATTLVHGLRQVKTAYERQLLAKSVAISADAHVAGMKAAFAGRYEYEVEAAIEAVYLKSGAMSWGYPSIVGGGPNATILHYGKSERKLLPGELLLVDAAGNYQGQTGDITRTYPVDGAFSVVQKDIYRLVFAAQEAGLKAAVVGNRTVDVEKAAAAVIKEGLLKLGLITDASGDQYRTWYTHGICHWIGLDVHDVGDYRRPLEAGMTFVVEPGLYIRPESLDNLAKTPENDKFAAAVRPAVEKYKGIGVRIEDSFLLSETGLVRLSTGVPRALEEVEALLQARQR
ncbi:MAG: Xaa-Pro aminopeptidase [Vicinamibacteria bacterium]|nr:Xaa-Pro aminopeptidase [Vicinamibacteria bacterium]